MKFTKFRIKNFQSHEDSEIVFHPGFNVIIGKTNHGKSAIFRSIRFILWDYWNKRYVRTGAKNVELEAEFDSNDVFKRTRGVNNEAVLNITQIFKSFGDELPVQLKQLLKVPDYKIDTDKELNVNVSAQQDPLFLISPTYSAPLVSKFFSRLSGIHIIDAANRNIDKEKKKQMDTLRVLDETINQSCKSLEILKDILNWKEILETNEAFLVECKNKEKQIIDMEYLFQRVNKVNENQKKLEKEETMLMSVDLEKISDCIHKSKLLTEYIELFNKTTIFNIKKKKIEETETQLKNIDISLVEKYIAIAKQIINYTDILNRVIRFNEKMKDVKAKIESYSTELIITNQTRKAFIESLGICPLCGTHLKT